MLISTIRGPLRNAPMFVKKLLSLAVAILIALGLLVILVWEPVIKASKTSPVFTALWILLVGLVPIGLIVSFFRILLSKPSQRRTLAPVGGPRCSDQHPERSKRFVMCQRSDSPMSAAWKRRRNESAR